VSTVLLLLHAKDKNIGEDFERKKINRAERADELRFLLNISGKSW